MAVALPELQDAYLPFYRTLVQDKRYLTELEREFVWLVVLTASQEHVGTHHLNLFYQAGGSEQQAEIAFRIVAWSASCSTFLFLSTHWQKYFPQVPAEQAYLDGAEALRGDRGVSSELMRLGLLAAHTVRRDHWGLSQEIQACYTAGVAEAKMVETLSLPIWPCGVNRFVEACDVWLNLMREGKVQPSPSFKAWADTPDQDGFPLPPRSAS